MKRLLIAFLLVPLSACVSQATYENARKELDASARALDDATEHGRLCDAERTELRDQRDVAMTRIADLEAEVQRLQTELGTVKDEAAAAAELRTLERLPPAAEDEALPRGVTLRPIAVKELEPSTLRARFEAGGWSLVNPPTEASDPRYRGVVFPVVRGAMGGAVALYEYDDLAAAERFEASMRAKGAATARHERKVISVLIQRYDGVAGKLLTFILGK